MCSQQETEGELFIISKFLEKSTANNGGRIANGFCVCVLLICMSKLFKQKRMQLIFCLFVCFVLPCFVFFVKAKKGNYLQNECLLPLGSQGCSLEMGGNESKMQKQCWAQT